MTVVTNFCPVLSEVTIDCTLIALQLFNAVEGHYELYSSNQGEMHFYGSTSLLSSKSVQIGPPRFCLPNRSTLGTLVNVGRIGPKCRL